MIFDSLDIKAHNRLNSRLSDDPRVSMAYRPMFRDIVATFRVPRQYKTATSTAKQSVSPSATAIITLLIIAAVFIVLMFAMPDIQLWLALGLTLTAFVAGKISGRVRVTETVTMVPDPNEQAIAAAEDAFYNALSPLIDMTRSDVYHREALRWLQAQYSDSDSVRFRSSAESLLKGFNCRFVEYSDADADAFEISTSNIPEVRTTRHAVFGPDNAILVPGHAVFPQN